MAPLRDLLAFYYHVGRIGVGVFYLGARVAFTIARKAVDTVLPYQDAALATMEEKRKKHRDSDNLG